MLGNKYYHGLMRKYIVYFGTLFNEIYIDRVDSDKKTQQTLKVPLLTAPKDKMIARIKSDFNHDREHAINLPVMSFEYTNMYFDEQRSLNPTGRTIRVTDTATNKKFIYNPVPYNLNFNLYIYSKNIEDGHRIIEQILPFFTPEWNATLNLIPEMEISIDTPVTVLSVQPEDVYEGAMPDRRVNMWTITFTMKAYLYGPKKEKPIINFVDVRSHMYDSNVPISEQLASNNFFAQETTQPGLTPEGEPTSDINESIDKDDIFSTDNYGYIVQYREGHG